jgi:hypothetical protein
MQVEYSQISLNFENKISVNLFSKAKTAVAEALGGGVHGLAPAYA